uniref:Uncharacterized protein n=1 Tax=Arcella intermedia TaxID=1963864 RepID=A0A6B2LLE9_9EUKA
MERLFKKVLDPTIAKLYYPAYNTLLSAHFPVTEGYGIDPRRCPIDDVDPSIQFTMTFVVLKEFAPVLFIAVQAPANLRLGTYRAAADTEVRSFYNSELNQCPLDELHGISVFGTKMGFYVGNKRTSEVMPSEVSRPPLDWWDNDILELEGANKLRLLFDSIKSSCQKI